jgi:predicted dehydrogenase
LKIGIVGIGKVASNYHIPAYRMIKGVTVTAICDNDASAVDKAAKKFGIDKTYSDLDEMLENESFDFVDICTPIFTHYEYSTKCLNKGVNILVEKPFVLTTNQATELKELAKKRNAEICLTMNYRFKDPSIKFATALSEGQIGSVKNVIVRQHGESIFGLPQWAWNEKQTGGLLYENAFHAVDIMSWILGPHKRILGCKINYDNSLDLTTSCHAMIENHDGALGYLDLAWFASSQFFACEVTGSACDVLIKFQPDSFRIVAGELRALDEAIAEIRRVSALGSSLIARSFQRKSILPHYRIIAGYVQSISQGTPPPVSVDDILPTLRLVEDLKKLAEV